MLVVEQIGLAAAVGERVDRRLRAGEELVHADGLLDVVSPVVRRAAALALDLVHVALLELPPVEEAQRAVPYGDVEVARDGTLHAQRVATGPQGEEDVVDDLLGRVPRTQEHLGEVAQPVVERAEERLERIRVATGDSREPEGLRLRGWIRWRVHVRRLLRAAKSGPF